jgi:hypothetical protein
MLANTLARAARPVAMVAKRTQKVNARATRRQLRQRVNGTPHFNIRMEHFHIS